MKKLLIILGVCVVWCTNAMILKSGKKMIPVTSFSVNNEIRVIQIPLKRKVKFDDVIKQEIYIKYKSSSHNNSFVYSIIKSDTSTETVKNILREALGVSKVKCQECYMSIEDYEEMDPPLISKNKIKKSFDEMINSNAFLSWVLRWY